MIDVLEKITELRIERHWTEYQLAEASGLTQSTISSWYRKDMLPTLPSLMKICDAFNISISQFFIEDNSNAVLLNDKQAQLIHSASKLDSNQYNALLAFLQAL
ncbi:MAG: helix-turn-helix transcriptional regulator [Lachnospiraceae bacterium]|nr:helix-turn-helix transcriptional regulator [Lachnospiraceae bacterium]